MALMMTSAVTYVAKISSPNTIASVMGLMGALFFGVGKGSGSLFGGLLMNSFGAPATFRTFAVTAFLCSIIYGFFQWLYVKPRRLLASDDGGSSVDHGADQVSSGFTLKY
jgi:predicted MFS family arabinose efflux permease